MTDASASMRHVGLSSRYGSIPVCKLLNPNLGEVLSVNPCEA